MPVFDVAFRIRYERLIRVEADDDDHACEKADDIVRGEIPTGKIRGSFDVDLYGIETVKADE